MLLNPVSLTRKANILKIGGSLGGAAVATVVLELVAQAVTRASSQAATFSSGPVPGVGTLPIVGDVTLKDVPSLIPAVAGALSIAKGRTKLGIMMVIGSVGAKAGLRAAGINPDEFGNKLGGLYDKYFKNENENEEDYEEPEVYF